MYRGQWGRRVAAGYHAHCRVVAALDLVDGRRQGIWRPNWGGVIKDGRDVRFVSLGECFLRAAPRRAGERAEQPQLLAAFPRYFAGVSMEMQMRVEVDAEDARITFEWDQRCFLSLSSLN